MDRRCFLSGLLAAGLKQLRENVAAARETPLDERQRATLEARMAGIETRIP